MSLVQLFAHLAVKICCLITLLYNFSHKSAKRERKLINFDIKKIQRTVYNS